MNQPATYYNTKMAIKNTHFTTHGVESSINSNKKKHQQNILDNNNKSSMYASPEPLY